MQLTMSPGWLEQVFASTDELFLTELGPVIYADAWRLCPVFGGENSTATSDASQQEIDDPTPSDTTVPGSLRDSLEFHLNGHSLVVSATGSDERSYCVFVELGHRVVAWGHVTGGSKGPQPFLRSALYTARVAA